MEKHYFYTIKGPVNEFLHSYYILQQEIQRVWGFKEQLYGVCEAEKTSACSDPLHLISLDYFNGTHSLKPKITLCHENDDKLKITLCHENDDKYFPEKPKMSIYEYLFFLLTTDCKQKECIKEL